MFICSRPLHAHRLIDGFCQQCSIGRCVLVTIAPGMLNDPRRSWPPQPNSAHELSHRRNTGAHYQPWRKRCMGQPCPARVEGFYGFLSAFLTLNAVCFRRQVASITGFIRHYACMPGPG
jgi:hypothetical protein